MNQNSQADVIFKKQNKIKQLQQMILNQQQTVTRLMEEKKTVLNQRSQKLLQKDIIIKQLQSKLKEKSNQLTNLQKTFQRKKQQYENQKKQDEECVNNFISEIEQLKKKNIAKQQKYAQMKFIFQTINKKINNIFHLSFQLSLDQSISINNMFAQLKKRDHQNSQISEQSKNFSQSEQIQQTFSIDPIESALLKLEDQFKSINEKLIRKQKQIKDLQNQIHNKNMEIQKIETREKLLRQQLKIAQDLNKKNREKQKIYEQLLNKNEIERNILANKNQSQYLGIIEKIQSQKKSPEELKKQKAILLIKIEQLQKRLQYESQQILNTKQANLKLSENMVQNIKQLKQNYEKILQKKNSQIISLKQKIKN